MDQRRQPVALSALADANHNADIANATQAFDTSEANAQLTYTQSDATLTYNLVTAEAANNATDSINEATADQTYENSVMTQYVGNVTTWAASLNSAQAAWGQYQVALAQTEKSDTQATEAAEVTAAQSDATADTTAANAIASDGQADDNATAQQDNQYNLAVINATDTRDVAKAYSAFNAVTEESGISYSTQGGISADFANQYDLAFAPIPVTSSDVSQSTQQQQTLDTDFDTFQAAIIPIAVTEAHALVGANYDYDTGDARRKGRRKGDKSN